MFAVDALLTFLVEIGASVNFVRTSCLARFATIHDVSAVVSNNAGSKGFRGIVQVSVKLVHSCFLTNLPNAIPNLAGLLHASEFAQWPSSSRRRQWSHACFESAIATFVYGVLHCYGSSVMIFLSTHQPDVRFVLRPLSDETSTLLVQSDSKLLSTTTFSQLNGQTMASRSGLCLVQAQQVHLVVASRNRGGAHPLFDVSGIVVRATRQRTG